MNEEWRLIPGYGARYSVSDFGRVRANTGIRSPMILANFLQTRKKYRRVNLYHPITGKIRQWGVHQLVALAFIGPVPDGQEVNHKDTNHANNRFDNLEYVTPLQNMEHAVENGLIIGKPGEHNSSAKLSDLDAIDIKTCIEIGVPDSELAHVYGVTKAAIAAIRIGRTWRHVRAWRLGELLEEPQSDQLVKYADQLAARDAA